MYQMKSTYFGIGIAVLLVALVSCKPDIEYREIIKEVPVEVVIEVPVVDESRINQLINQLNQMQKQHEAQLTEIEERYNAQIQELKNNSSDNTFLFQQIEELEMAHQQEIWETNSNFETEKAALQNKINHEVNSQLDELKEYYESQLNNLEETYNAKLEELHEANINNNALQTQIDKLEKEHSSKIEELSTIYNNKIKDLEGLLIAQTRDEIFELRVFRLYDPNHYSLIDGLYMAKNRYLHYVKYYNYTVELEILYDTNYHLKRVIEESEYVNSDFNSICNDIAKNGIAYGSYHDVDDYLIFWIVYWLF